MANASSSSAPGEIPKPDKEKKTPKPKTTTQEAWNKLKAANVKVIEADGLELKLKNSGMHLTFDAIKCLCRTHVANLVLRGLLLAGCVYLRGNQFVDALMADSDSVIQALRSAYVDLKDCIARDLSEDEKKQNIDQLTPAMSAFDIKMRSVKKAMPDVQPKAKAGKTPKAKARK